MGATTTQTPCAAHPNIFLHPLLEDYPSNLTVAEHDQQAMLRDEATRHCLACPLLSQCLYRAVVTHDVAGYVAATTPRQRTRLRRMLGVVVAPETLDGYVGVFCAGRKVDHEAIIRVREQYPRESLESLATRLGCSVSTVKRHLRQARAHAIATPRPQAAKPSIEQVEQAWIDVTGGHQARSGPSEKLSA